MWERRTEGKGSGFWPTPRAQDSKHGAATEWELTTDHAGTKDSLRVHVAKRGMWPTPRANNAMAEDVSTIRERGVDKGRLEERVAQHEEAKGGGQLNPNWVEWLMGWPIGWTDLKPLETDRFHEWLQQHGHS